MEKETIKRLESVSDLLKKPREIPTLNKEQLDRISDKINEKIKEKRVNDQIAEIGKLLRETRQSKKIKQIQIAKATGLSKQMISKIENGKNYTLSTLLKYCEYIEVDLVKILNDHINHPKYFHAHALIPKGKQSKCVICDKILDINLYEEEGLE